MNKKTLMLAVFGVMALAMVSALVVSYISNNVNTKMNVEHPLALFLSEDGSSFSDEDLVMSSVYAGDVFEFKLKSEYYGENALDGITILATVTNDNTNVDCNDFEELTVTAPTDINTGAGTIPAGTPFDLTQICVDEGDYVTFSIPAKYGYNEEDRNQIYNISGEYDLGIVPAEYTINVVANYN